MKPNLFNYGVGELTNDAIISWCLDWGNFPDSKLYSLSVDLIRMFTNNNDIEVKNVKIFNQKKNIDILAIVNDKIVLTIEDKLYTKAREGQLKKYKEITKSIYEELDKYYIYITIGDEDSYEYIKEEGYSVVERIDLLSILKNYKGHNNILDDYFAYLDNIELDYNSYLDSKELKNWSNKACHGFFKNELYPIYKQNLAGWSYVPNRSGGFEAFYWAFTNKVYNNKIPYEVYLQIELFTDKPESNNIVFKVSLDNKDYRSEIRDYNIDLLQESIKGKHHNVLQPKRRGHGRTMTFGVIENFATVDELIDKVKFANELFEKLYK